MKPDDKKDLYSALLKAPRMRVSPETVFGPTKLSRMISLYGDYHCGGREQLNGALDPFSIGFFTSENVSWIQSSAPDDGFPNFLGIEPDAMPMHPIMEREFVDPDGDDDDEVGGEPNDW